MCRVWLIGLSLILVLMIGMIAAQEQRQSQIEKIEEIDGKKLIDRSRDPVFMNARIWLVYSLSRFDIAIDNNLIEIRADVQLRKKSERGELIRIADVRVNDQRLEFQQDRFKKKRILPGKLASKVILKLHIPNGPCIKQVIVLPGWLKMTSPKPAVYVSDTHLDIGWEYSNCVSGSYTNLRIRDFLNGKMLLKLDEIKDTSYRYSLDQLPKGESLLRIFVIEPWFHVRKAEDPMLTKESKINVIAWSQSFVRVKK